MNIFICGYVGTGKTYVWTLFASIRSREHIVLIISSIGITLLFPTGGCTAHSRFGLPFNFDKDSMCLITIDINMC